MKTISLIHYAYPPNLGGVEQLLQSHALLLSQMGYSVSILTGNGKSPGSKISLTEVPEFQSLKNFNPRLQQKILEQGTIDEEFYALSQVIEDKLEQLLAQTDVVIVHNMLTVYRNLPFTNAFHQYARKHPEKTMISWTHDHNYIGEGKIKDIGRIHKSEVEKKLLTTPCPNIHYVAVSDTFKKLLAAVIGLSESDITTIPDGIDLYQFLEIEPTIQQLWENNLLRYAFPLITSPVNITERKNIEYNIEIVAELKQHYPAIKYLITGQPSRHRDTDEYTHTIESRIQSLGLSDDILLLKDWRKDSLAASELHDLYSLSDAIFYFSKSENFGLPILESFMTKTLIFTSALDVFSEIGTRFLHSIDYHNTSPREAAAFIYTIIEETQTLGASYHVRTTYHLPDILGKLLIPLIEKK
jgi:mannosylglucosylglycerate synthase